MKSHSLWLTLKKIFLNCESVQFVYSTFLGYFVENPIGSTTKLKFKPSICKSSSSEVFNIIGSFTSKRLDTNKPTIKITGPTNSILFKWIFHKGGLNANDADQNNTFVLSSANGTSININPELILTGLKLETSLDFSISISCDMTAFTLTFNNGWSQSIEYNTTYLDNFPDLSIAGAVTVLKAGYGGKVQ